MLTEFYRYRDKTKLTTFGVGQIIAIKRKRLVEKKSKWKVLSKVVCVYWPNIGMSVFPSSKTCGYFCTYNSDMRCYTVAPWWKEGQLEKLGTMPYMHTQCSKLTLKIPIPLNFGETTLTIEFRLSLASTLAQWHVRRGSGIA